MLFAPQGSTCVKRLAFAGSVPNEPTDFTSAHRGESRAFRVQNSKIMHREVGSIESATYSVQKSGANVCSPAEIQTETLPTIHFMLLGFVDKASHLDNSPFAFRFRYNNRENADIFGTAIKGC
jgi:hypothetical protein